MQIGKLVAWAHLGLLCSVVGVGCGGGEKKPKTTTQAPVTKPMAQADAAPPKPTVVGPALVFSVEPTDAGVVVDGKDHGTVAELENRAIKVAPGLHQVTIRKQGFKTWRAEVTVGESPEAIKVKLEALAP